MRSFWRGILGAVALLASLQPLHCHPGVVENAKQKALIPEDEMIEILNTYNTDAVQYCRRQSLANWDVQTHVGEPGYQEVQVI